MVHHLRLLLIAILLAAAAFVPAADSNAAVTEMPPAPVAQERVVVAQHGAGYVELINGQMVIHLKGSYYDMGYQHGRMLPERVRQTVDAYVKILAINARNHTLPELLGWWKQAEPFIPQAIKDELRGLADGSGVPLEEILAAHILPAKYHCSGAAAWGSQTLDGKLYHYRSLDYSISIGNDVKVQENAALILRQPTNKVASAVVGWTGTIGCVTGMNHAGISIGEMGCGVRDETFAGFPMFFLLRYILDEATSLDEALDILKRAPRTCGYNFIFSDGKGPNPRAVALEVDRYDVKVFEGGDDDENVEPHWAIRDAVRRVNHFVSPEMAKKARNIYDPRQSEANSWLGYKMISEYLEEHAGRIGWRDMVAICRAYPPTHPCLHQAVMCPSDGRIWVSNAVDPADTAFAGAQNNTFWPYDLDELFATDVNTLKKGELPPAERPHTPETQQSKTITGSAQGTSLGGGEPTDTELRAIWKKYRDASTAPTGGSFNWEMEALSSTASVDVSMLRFPSAVANGGEANRTVHAKVFSKRETIGQAGRRGALVLLHHLADDQTLEQMMANYFATSGGNRYVVMMYMPNYGPRSGGRRIGDLDLLQADGEASFTNIAQAVWDIHRVRDWLHNQPFIDKDDVAVFGVSLGGIITSISAGVDPGFDKYVLGLAGGDLKSIVLNESRETRPLRAAIQRRGLTDDQLTEVFRPIDPLTFAARAKGADARYFMINVTKDEVIPRGCTDRLWKAFGEPEIKWYDADHTGMAAHLFDALSRVKDFLAKN